MNFNVGFGTDIGRKRQQNQDRGTAYAGLGLFVVADGMGGHRGGETASTITIDVIPKFVEEAQKSPEWNPKQVASEAIRAANRAVYQRAVEQPELQGMGTTTTALLFHTSKAGAPVMIIGHVGDSRCYYFRKEGVWQITRDHSLVQEKLRAGLITREQVKTDRMKNVITRSVGFEPDVSVEIYEMPVQVGDVFLICSDGLSGLIEDADMLSVVQKLLFESKDIQGATNELIRRANANGGDDNITTVVIQVLE
jgi:serine/threonine protein phosphatase PrpC